MSEYQSSRIRLPLNEEHKKKIGDSQRGKKLTNEHKEKISKITLNTG